MTTHVRILKDFETGGKPLIVGLPGMGRVGYVSVNYIIRSLDAELVAEIYSTHFPPHLLVRGKGLSDFFVGRLYDSEKALLFTADVQPQNPEGQNEVCDALLSFLHRKGVFGPVVAAAAFVVQDVGESRKVFVAGNSEDIIRRFSNLGGMPLDGGVIVGINGAIVGWARYYSVEAAVLLGETWSVIVEFDETDYRAAKAVVDVLAKFLGVKTDTSVLLRSAEAVENNLAAVARRVKESSRRERKEVL